MELSVIIVSYNVKHFLEQCLLSVQKAITSLNAEVIVVDNASSDGSAEHISRNFPEVKLIAGKENTGFARANNTGLLQARGGFILFLNPDTIVQPDTFSRCLHFMRQHPEAGALGIKMINGEGKYLPESKRGFPSPLAAFFKLSGITALFPRSRLFARYYLGHLDENKNQETDVLSGAFFLTRKTVLEETGGFDERFFMYAEDIDLSYRIQQAGYKNYYFAESSIIHFKGESTNTHSLHYTRLFYKAMHQFVKKHYSGSGSVVYIAIIRIGIGLRAALSGVVNVFQQIKKRIFTNGKNK